MSIHSVKKYQNEIEKIIHFGGTKNETSLRNAFYTLLNEYAGQKNLMVVTEVTIKNKEGKNIRPDGVLKDWFRQDWGYWESKDESDNLDVEIEKKFAKGYPNDNIIFEDSQTAVLIQNSTEVMRVIMKEAEELDKLLREFISYERSEIQNFREAIELFKEDIPIVTKTIREIIIKQGRSNLKFIEARDKFLDLCRESINSEITLEDIREMMIQHILTEDIFNTIFDEPHFHRENNIARELEIVILTFFTGEIRRIALSNIQHYYQTINAAAASIPDHHEKQKFLKVLYETFYKSYNPKAADRLGVVYTPNEIVKFMIESSDFLLYKHFGMFLEDKGVEILDPAAGTGTYICDIIDFIQDKDKLKYKYENELHANEIAILPYYIANLNIEFTYKQKTGNYDEYKNLCFVDTLDNMGFDYREKQQTIWGLSSENIDRIKKQNKRKISVIIGNPPYNARQANYNFQNANKSYKDVDGRIKNTYIKYGTAQNQIVIYDMYTRFYRWASDRLSHDGIIAFITNNSFINGRSFDGFRKCIQNEFQYAYFVDLGGNIRELSGKDGIFLGEKHTVFGLAAMVGITIGFLVKKEDEKDRKCEIRYIHPCDTRATREEKIDFLSANPLSEISFEHIIPDSRNNWIKLIDNDFDEQLSLIDKNVKSGKAENALFKLFSLGVATHRDKWVYDLNEDTLVAKIKYLINTYTSTMSDPNFIDRNTIAWDRELKKYLDRRIKKKFNPKKVIISQFRPFVKQFYYFDRHFTGMIYQFEKIISQDFENKLILVNREGNSKPFHCLATNCIADLHTTGDSQCLPYYRIENGEVIENITDWGLKLFQDYYHDNEINKDAIFHYVYGILHNPGYRKKYELNLKRDFPRIPFYKDFWLWSNWGKELMDLHINYETVEPFKLKEITNDCDFRSIPKLKPDREVGEIALDDATVLSGIPDIAWEYKLGYRSAIDWVLDQYKEKKSKDKTISEKFNTYKFIDFKGYVIDLIRRVTTVSIETMKIVQNMEQESE